MSKITHIKTVSIIGAGSWGTTIAKVIADNWEHLAVKIWAYEKSVVSSINSSHVNSDFLPDIELPKNITATSSLKDALSGTDVLLIATPSKVIYDISKKISKLIAKDAVVGYLSKGFCRVHENILTISQTLDRNIPQLRGKFVAVSGPSHAEEVSMGYHTCLNVGSADSAARSLIAELISSPYLSCREKDDIIGVELGGTLKNPAAVAAGMISVLSSCGDNLAGALISEALKEMIKLGKVFGVREETIIDISGLGDLVATALSEHSRNRRFGKDISNQIISKGKSVTFFDRIFLRLKPESVIERMSEKLNYLAEGAYAIEPLIELAEAENVSIPVYRSLYEVLLNKKDPSLLIETIKNPSKFEELYFNTKIQISERKKGLEKVTGKVFQDKMLERVMERFFSSGDKGIAENAEEIMANLRDYSEFYQDESVENQQSVEFSIIREMTSGNFESSLESLARVYIREITDNFNTGFKWMFMKILRLIMIINFIIRKKGAIRISGLIGEIKKVSVSVNILYVSNVRSFFDSIFIILALQRRRLPFPRFFVMNEMVPGRARKILMKLAGGFIVDRKKIGNLVYRESLCQYLSTMMEHGVPVLYFPSYCFGDNFEGDNEFFSTISGALYQHTVEIALLPIEVTHVQKPADLSEGRPSLFSILQREVNVNFSRPLFLSEYTKQPHLIIGLPGVVKSIWKSDEKIYPHFVISHIIEINNFILPYDVLKKNLKDFMAETSISIDYSRSEIMKKGMRFLIQNGVVAHHDGIITTVDRRELEYYAGLVKSAL